MNRREYLLTAVTVGLSSIAGCSGDTDDSSDSGDNTVETTTTEEETTTTEEETETATEEETTKESEPAEFVVQRFDHPEEVEVGESHQISVTVENTGGETGTYEELLEISVKGTDEWENVGYVTVEDIDPGETGTWETDPFDYESPGTLQLRLGEKQTAYSITITAPDPQSFAGSGEEVRRDISIEGGLTVVEATHDGESNFIVSLAGGEYDDIFVNEIGSFDGAQAALIDSGDYILDVDADGSWEVTIKQPRSGEGENLPISYTGNGPDVIGPVQFSGTGVASGSHTGESNFVVNIYPMTGSFGELVFNEIGSFEGETTFSFDGIGWIDIDADGDWSVEFE